jgi:hypothetical protein
MFTFIFNFKYYRFFKSGLLLDFILKKLALNCLYTLFLVFNIFFNEKYIIEFLFFKFSAFNSKIRNYTSIFSNEFTFATLSLFILIIAYLFIFIYLILVAFTHI